MQPVNHPVRRISLALGLALAAAAAAAQTALALDDEVRALVQPLVTLPEALRDQARVQIQLGRIDPRLQLAPCRRIEPRWPSHARAWGRTHVALRCVDGEKPWQVYLPVTVQVLAPALVPSRALAAGTVLAESDLARSVVDWAASPRTPLWRTADAMGRTLVRAMQPGQALARDDLRQRQWFSGGDVVKVVARGAGFSVSGEGQALGPGIEGQPVRVRTESGRVLSGMAVGERRVEVLL